MAHTKGSSLKKYKFSAKNTVKELESIAKEKFPEVALLFFNKVCALCEGLSSCVVKEDSTKWYKSGRPKWRKQDLVDAFGAVETLDFSKVSVTKKAKPISTKVVSLKVSPKVSEKKSKKVPKKLEDMIQQPHVSPVESPKLLEDTDPFVMEDEQMDFRMSLENGLVLDTIRADAIENNKLEALNQKEKHAIPPFKTAITPIANENSLDSKTSGKMMLDKLFPTGPEAKTEEAGMEWLRQILESYDNVKATKVAPQMKCRTA